MTIAPEPILPILATSRQELLDIAVMHDGGSDGLSLLVEQGSHDELEHVARKAGDLLMNLIGESYSDVLLGELKSYFTPDDPVNR